jgi:hypothetical protein
MSHIDDIVGALPLRTAANVLEVSHHWLLQLSASIVLLQLKDSNIPLGTGIVIHPSLILTSKHNLEGLKSINIQAGIGYSSFEAKPLFLSVEGVVESNDTYDFVILKLLSPIPEDSGCVPVRLQFTSLVPEKALLMHHSQGGPIKCTNGRVIFYTTQNFPIVQALIFADVLSSGGGYFDSNGNCFGMHVSVGRLGLTPTKEILTINTILRCSPKNSIMEQIALGKPVSIPTIMDDKVSLKVSFVGEQNPLISRAELSIPIIFTIWIPRLYPNKLQIDEAKYFYKLLVYGIVESHLFSTQPGITLVSFGRDGLFRDDQSACRDKFINIGGIRVDFMGYSQDNRYRVFQACINLPPRENLSETERTLPRHDTMSTVIAQVEMISQAEYYYSSTVNMTKELTNRLRIALYRSYHSKRIARIT